MNELKAIEMTETPVADYYLKSEADKVIAELKAENERLELDKRNQELRADLAEAELRHANYKRCLAMARWCACRSLAFVDENWAKSEWYDKWKFTWLALAEHYKEETR